MIPKPHNRIVLDTNVCLDLFVFRDPRWQRLLSAMQCGEVMAITRADCRMEWTLVLAYTRLGLDAEHQAAALAEFDSLIRLFEAADHTHELTRADAASSAPPWSVLPVCRDPDDQKFLELAAASQASVLITKDKALLKLARKTKKLGWFEILTPEQWTAAADSRAAEAAISTLQ